MKPNLIDLSNYKYVDSLGEGSFGSILLIQENKTQKFYTAQISKAECKSKQEQKAFIQGIQTLLNISSHSVLSIKGISLKNFNNERYPTIISEYMSKGSLNKLMRENSDLSISKRYIILLGIAEGMKSLHAENIIHCNLTPNNILIDQDLHPYISEYGLLKIIQTFDSSLSLKYYPCSPLYMAPEVISNSQYSDKSDVYSFSIIAYELLTGTFPYPKAKNPYSIQKVVLKGIRPKISLIQDESLQLLLTKCWSAEPENRPTFNDIVSTLKKGSIIKTMKINKKEVDSYLNLFTPKLPALNPNSKQTKEESKTKKDSTSNESQKKANDIKNMADKGNPKSMYIYAKMLETGEGITKNMTESIKYYKMAADKGNVDAIFRYAEILDKGINVKSNKKEATRLYKLAADQGHIESMVSYGMIITANLNHFDYDEEEFNEIKNEATKYFKMAKEKGNVNGTFKYGEMIYDSYIYPESAGENNKEGVRCFKFAADRGHIDALRRYACALFHGNGIEKNCNEAIRLLKEAANKGDAQSMYNLFIIYHDGPVISIGKDIDESFRYLIKAANLGLEEAIKQLCQCLYYGQIDDINDKDIIRFYKMGIKISEPTAVLGYGDLLYYGIGVKENKAEAARYYEKAIEMDEIYKDGKIKLSYMCYKGEYDKGDKNYIFNCDSRNRFLYHYRGLIYLEGDGTKNCKDINKKEAAYNLYYAVDTGCVLSLYYYGILLYNGEGYGDFKVELEKAAHCFALAAKKGDKRAKKMYDSMIEKGEYVEDNDYKFINDSFFNNYFPEVYDEYSSFVLE